MNLPAETRFWCVQGRTRRRSGRSPRRRRVLVRSCPPRPRCLPCVPPRAAPRPRRGVPGA